MGKRKSVDWEAIAEEYRAGQLSIRAIARAHEISDAAIHGKIKRDAKKGIVWERDLTEKVRKRVRAKLVSANISSPNTNASDEEIISAAADRGKEVVLNHRKDIASLCELEAQLLEELKAKPKKVWVGQFQGEIVSKELSLTASERAQAANNLANVQHKRIQLERQAFNLDVPDDESSTPKTIKVIYGDKIGVGKDIPET